MAMMLVPHFQPSMHKLVRFVLSSSQFVILHVHANAAGRWANCSIKEHLNHKMDRLATYALIAGYGDEDYALSSFPFEPITIKLHGTKDGGDCAVSL